MSLMDAIPAPWRKSLKTNGYVDKISFVLQDHIQLVLDNQNVLISEVTSKRVYWELISGLVAQPTAQLKYNETFDDICLDWKEIYSLPFKVWTQKHENFTLWTQKHENFNIRFWIGI